MALGRMLNSYADRYIQTGSAAPIIHVVSTVGFGGYVYHSFLHWLETSKSEKLFAEKADFLKAQISQKEKDLKDLEEQAKTAKLQISTAKQNTVALSQKLMAMDKQAPQLVAELKGIKEQLEAHVQAGPKH